MSSCINTDEPYWRARGPRQTISAGGEGGGKLLDVPHRRCVQNPIIRAVALTFLQSGRWRQPPPVPPELHRQHGTEPPTPRQLDNTTRIFFCLPIRLFLKEYWDIYGGKTAKRGEAFGRSVGSASHRGLFFSRSARAAWRAASVNVGHSSPHCLLVWICWSLIRLLWFPPPPQKKTVGGNAFCFAHLPPNSVCFVSLWHQKRPNQTSLNGKTNGISLNFVAGAKGIKIKADPWRHFWWENTKTKPKNYNWKLRFIYFFTVRFCLRNHTFWLL